MDFYSIRSFSLLAYLDPGSGSFIIQLIIAGALGGMFLLRSYIGRLFASVRRLFGRKDKEDKRDE